MGIQASRPKYHITARNAGGPDHTSWWTHSHEAFDRKDCERFAAHYAKHYPDITIILTPESGPCGIFTRFPTGYRYWAWTDQFHFVDDVSKMPKTEDELWT